MRRAIRYAAAFLVAATIAFSGTVAKAAGNLTLYCTVQIEWCEIMKQTFEKETGIRVAMTRKSSGEWYAQIKAEASNPKGDIWWGGTGDPHLQAAEEGLTDAYQSPMMKELHEWAINQAKAANYRTIGVYSGALGFGYDPAVLKKRNMPEPKCWGDLTNAAYKGEIQIANPNSSGTSYTTLATMVQLLGEAKAFDWLKALHKNINQYTKSGSAPIKAVAQGETAIGITFMHDIVTMVVNGAPIKIVAPCEGTGYEIGSMSLIKGARNVESAKKYYDWALRADVQMLAVKAKAYQIGSNQKAIPPKESPNLAEIKLINYDFKKYGSKVERTRLLKKWDTEVNSLPR